VDKALYEQDGEAQGDRGEGPLVNVENLNITNLLIRFRQMAPFQQAVIVGAIVFIIYGLYDYLMLGMGSVEAISTSIYSALIFLVVYYITSVVIMKRSPQAGTQVRGPKKGLRNK
jgi:MFS superfamily sulfate permease-like transporter